MNSVSVLPPGWTQHRSPTGQPYYYNAQTKESTYTKPETGMNGNQAGPEKPLYKSVVTGTNWFRVKTTVGNVFWFNSTSKQSTWIQPDEVKAAGKKVEEERKKIAESSKRKAEESEPLDEMSVAKKMKTDGGGEEDESDEEDEEDSEEEGWQIEAAAQLAAEAEMEKVRKEKEAKEAAETAEREKEQQKIQQAIPQRVELSLEEGKALFKALLTEKDINPLHPWDVALPKFVNDPRYVLLSSVAARREAFDEYCRDRLREQRQNTVSREKAAEKNPKEEFQKLLDEEVKSTRASWTDFRRAWKKDRRFYGWGRNEREREKAFRDHVKQLGEKKRDAAQRAEADFLNLLKESKEPTDANWKDVKRQFYNDPRYDAVGSSSLREELFNTYKTAAKQRSASHVNQDDSSSTNRKLESELTEEEKAKQRRERKERAVKEREKVVQSLKNKIDSEIGKSRNEVYKEEGERDFRTMLTDAIRDPQITWEDALPQLRTDPRFRNSPLPPNQQLHLFHTHIQHLRSKHINGLHTLFEAHAPTLAVKFSDLSVPSLLSSAPVTKLGYSLSDLKRDFDTWQRQRYQLSRSSFDEMLNENSFVEFWGRLGKIGGEGVNGGVKADDEEEEDEGIGGGGKVDMKELAKNVNVDEIEKVLKNDKRYIMFDHITEERTQWIRDYLSNLSAPRMSFHIPS